MIQTKPGTVRNVDDSDSDASPTSPNQPNLKQAPTSNPTPDPTANAASSSSTTLPTSGPSNSNRNSRSMPRRNMDPNATDGSSDEEDDVYDSQMHSRASTYLDGARTEPIVPSVDVLADGTPNPPRDNIEPGLPFFPGIDIGDVPTSPEPDTIDGEPREAYILKPVPHGTELKCRIIRRKEGVEKLYPQYEMFVEPEDGGGKIFAMAARKRKKSKSSNYVISTTRITSTKVKDRVVGKLRSNFIGTAFTLYDNGRNPFKPGHDAHLPLRQEFASVLYETNVLGFRGPRKMTVILPGMTKTGERTDIRPENEAETLLERNKSGADRELLCLHNKTPQWSAASVKNFQIVHDNDLDYIIMQFGRVSDDTFTLDFKYPLSPIQAFGIALTR
ncbi:hypothetical protein HDU76_000112 [Blyttiomyces sp. JEL0837]|nr:hypothetical protein HDU76_000112 [Blyttiomyces sp. JEL0837]